jgi:surfeit locus 1 family protein
MNAGALRFRPPWWAAVLAAAGCAAGILLGNWQSGRAEHKRALAATQKLEALRGSFDATHTVLLDNKLHRGRPGYHVVQPLRLADGRRVLVNRGWLPAPATREQLPAVRTPGGEVSLQGERLDHFPRALEPAASERKGKVWQNLSVREFASWSGLALEPYVIVQHSALDDGLARDWLRPDAGAAKHESYALQWYSLAALSLILFLVLNLKLGKRSS